MKIVIYGLGQTGQMVSSILHEQNHQIMGYVDDHMDKAKLEKFQQLYLGSRDYLVENRSYDAVCIGIGTIQARLAVAEWLEKQRIPTISAIHSSAVISAEATLGKNLIIGANSTMYVNPIIGDGCFIGPSVTVSHDSEIGRFCLLSVGSVVGARCDLEDRVFVGTSSTIMPTGFGSEARLRVGSGSVIGVGSTVIRDVPRDVTVIGTPAKLLIKG